MNCRDDMQGNLGIAVAQDQWFSKERLYKVHTPLTHSHTHHSCGPGPVVQQGEAIQGTHTSHTLSHTP